MVMRLFFSCVLLGASHAHFAMWIPTPWLDPKGEFVPSVDERSPGVRSAGCTGETPIPGHQDNRGCISQWYTNWTFIPKARTIPDELLTFAEAEGLGGHYEKHPWMAPGSAPLFSPCGHDGGNPTGCPPNSFGESGICQGGGYPGGPDARELKGPFKMTEWTQGMDEEVAFVVTANHGGGYSYRLCHRDDDGGSLTEECFERTPLRFAEASSWLQYGPDASNRTEFEAVRTDVGTFPEGSHWTRNPVPACGGFGGALTDSDSLKAPFCRGSQFSGVKMKGREIKGFYAPTDAWPLVGSQPLGPISVVDKVAVPSDIATGDYVLSFRIDCEQTPQVWSMCADVRIVAPDGV